jgi:hypothetical protein
MANKSKNNKHGLNREDTAKALKDFLSSLNEIRVFAIKGDWGIGKTYLVKRLLEEQAIEHHYGSVFGVSSIEELKTQLWCNFRSARKRKKHKNIFFDTRGILRLADNNSQDLGNLIEALPSMESYGAGFTPAVLSLASNFIVNNSLKNKLICVDDLERRSRKLSLEELLGFIEILAEEKDCKIILIYNDEEVCREEDDKELMKGFREKVIDFEIELNPHLEENIKIVFGANFPEKDFISEYFFKNELQTKNIRILNKIKWVLSDLKPYIKNLLPKVRLSIEKEAIFFVLAKFHKRFPVDFELLKSFDGINSIQPKVGESEHDIYYLALMLGYSGTSISDELISLIETSTCDHEKITEESSKLNEREKNHQIREKLNKACMSYYESFSSTEQEMLHNLTSFLDQYWPHLVFREFSEISIMSSVIGLDIQPYIQKWIQHKIDNLESLEDLYSLQSNLQKYQGLVDDEYQKRIAEKISSREDELSIEKILTKITESGTRSKKDTEYLNSRSVKECIEWLLEKHPDKLELVREGLRIEEEFSKNLRMAIIELSERSPLNKMRAEMLYRIKIEESEKPSI